MRICIPIPFRPEGGGQYFLQLFRAYLSKHGHQVVDDVDDRYDVLFTNHWVVPAATILRGLRQNPEARVVQRIDGVAADYGRFGNADRRQHLVNRLADVTIFQSEYCRWTARSQYRVIGQDGPVIHNPVDVEQFTPDGPRTEYPEAMRVACVSWSTNQKKGAAHVYAVAAANQDVGFYLCGRYEHVPPHANVHALGVLDRQSLATVLRSCHVLLTFSENEACPNHVLEALASGRSVLFTPSGAMGELVGPCGRPVDESTFRSALMEIVKDWTAHSSAARERAMTLFHPDRVLPRYVDVIQEGLRRPRRRGFAGGTVLPHLWPLLVPFRRWGVA